MAPTMIGQTIPDSVPTPLEMPIKILAYLGAMSKWFTLNPETYTETVAQGGITLKKQVPGREHQNTSSQKTLGAHHVLFITPFKGIQEKERMYLFQYLLWLTANILLSN